MASNEYCQNLKRNFKYRKVPQYNLWEKEEYMEKQDWKKYLDDIDQKVKNKCRISNKKIYNTSKVLPPKLLKRVAAQIPMHKYTKMDIEKDSDIESKDEKWYLDPTLADQLQGAEIDYKQIDLKIDLKPLKRSKPICKTSWYSEFINTEGGKAIIWDTKVFQKEKKEAEQPVDETEVAMNKIADDFCNWINAIGDEDDDDAEIVAKEMVMKLFSFEIEGDVRTAIAVDPKQMFGIPMEIANRWKKPELSLEAQIEKAAAIQKKKLKKKPVTVAFGSSLPPKERPWVPVYPEKTLETSFPENLLTCESLFKGITQLRSTQAVIKHLEKNPTLNHPKYLVDNGFLKPAYRKLF